MSEGSRGVQAPSRPDDATDLDTGAEPGHAAESDDDFYATVNNAAANRSTRVRHAEPDAPSGSAEGGADYARTAMPWDADAGATAVRPAEADSRDADAVEAGADSEAEPGADSGAETAAAGAHAEGDSFAPESRSWRSRWNDLTTSIRGKRAESDSTTDSVTAGPAAVGTASAVKTDRAEPTAAAETAPASSTAASETATNAAATSEAAMAPVPAAGAGALAARPGEQLAPRTKPKLGAPHRTRKARLRLSRIDPWSVMKTSFLFSIAAGIVLVVAVYVIWTVIGSSGLFSSINDIVSSVVSTPGDTTPFRIEEYVNTQKVMGVTAFVACIDVVIFTALATLISFLYNLASTMLGGLEVTLAED